jgi:NitT/TauT family transport system substrate-binding protein
VAASPLAAAKPSGVAASAVKIAWVNITANQMLWPLTYEAGYFGKHGVNAELTYLQGSTLAGTALVSGQIAMAQTGGQVVVGARAAKQDMIMPASFQNEMAWELLAVPSIKTIQDLKGKTMAVGKVGIADYFAWPIIAGRQGWTAGDFKYVNSNDVPGQITLLGSGNAVATFLQPPFEVPAQRAGLHRMLNMADGHVPLTGVGMVVTQQWLAQNRATAINVIKASIEGIHR